MPRMKISNATPRAAGSIRRMVTRKNVVYILAPEATEASSKEGSIERNAAVMKRNGV
jgi:hypothetical protein